MYNSLDVCLKIWEENSWLLFLDRNDSFGGRFSEKGILKRFTPLVDSKHQLDVLGSQFNPVEDFYWNSKTNGVRWRGTSATTLTLTSSAEFKTSIDLGGPWKMCQFMGRDQRTTDLPLLQHYHTHAQRLCGG